MLYASPSPQKSNSNIARPQTNRVSRPGSKLTEGGYKEDYNKRVSKIHSKPPILLCSSHMLRKLRSTKGANLMQRACDAYWQKGGTTRRERIILRANTLRCPCTNPSIALCFALRHFPTPPSPPPPCRQKREKSSWNRERSCAGARSTQQGKPRSREGAVYVLRTRQSSSLTLLIRLSAMFRADWFRPWWHFGYNISQRKKEKERIFFLYCLESFPLNANGWWVFLAQSNDMSTLTVVVFARIELFLWRQAMTRTNMRTCLHVHTRPRAQLYTQTHTTRTKKCTKTYAHPHTYYETHSRIWTQRWRKTESTLISATSCPPHQQPRRIN